LWKVFNKKSLKSELKNEEVRTLMSKNTSTEIIEHNGKQIKEKYGVEVYRLLHGLSCTKLDKEQGYFLLTLMDELLKAK
jgi:hypothetical protein